MRETRANLEDRIRVLDAAAARNLERMEVAMAAIVASEGNDALVKLHSKEWVDARHNARCAKEAADALRLLLSTLEG